jgi:hypothetical protein
MSLTEKEKSIYNCYLIASRTIQNKPFKLRQDFNSIDSQVYTTLKKLGIFFQKYNNIKQVDFFTAPFSYYGIDNFFDIHSHLDYPDYKNDFDLVIDRMKENNISAITVGTDLNSSKNAVMIAEKHKNIWEFNVLKFNLLFSFLI